MGLGHNRDGVVVRLAPPERAVEKYIHNEDSQHPLFRGQLLAQVQTGKGGKERVWMHRYESRFSQVTRTVGPEGTHRLADPALHASYYNYDYKRGVGNAGNLVDQHGPRSLYHVYEPSMSGQGRPLWIDANPEAEWSYNGFGLPTASTDEEGIKTEYRYFATQDPTGRGGGRRLRTAAAWCGTCQRQWDTLRD